MADINDLIANGIRPVQVPLAEDPTTAATKQATLGDLMQRQQIGAQQMRMNDLTLAQQESDQADTQAINNAYATHTDPTGKLDRTGVISDLTAAGRGTAAAKVQTGFTAQDTLQAKQIEAQNQAQTSSLNLTHQKASMLGQLAQSVLDAPPEGKQAAYTSYLQDGARLGVLSGDHIAQHDPNYNPSMDASLFTPLSIAAEDTSTRAKIALDNLTQQKDQGDVAAQKQKWNDNWNSTVATQAALMETPQQLDAYRQRATAQGAPPSALAQIPQDYDPTDPDQRKQLRQSVMSPAEIGAETARDKQIDQAAANAAETHTRDVNTAANEAARLRIEAQAQFLRQKTFDATLGQGLDTNGQPQLGTDGKPVVSAAAQLAGSYQIPVTPYMIARMPGFLAQVKAANPDFDVKNFDAAKQIRTGPQNANTEANNTAIVHLDQLAEAAKALDNGTFVPGNALYNSLAATFGSGTVTNAASIKAAVASEMATALKGTATDQEINGINKTLDNAGSPAQIAGRTVANIGILAAKLNTRDEAYHQAVGARDPWHPVLPTAQAVLDKYGVKNKPQIAPPTSVNPFR